MKYVIFDTETGGLDDSTSALCSLGAVVWDSEKGGRLTTKGSEFYTLVYDPKGELTPSAMRVNGLDPEVLKAEGKPMAETWAAFVKFCQGIFGKTQVLLGGHNTGFDVGYLKRLARETGNAARYEAIFSHRTVCTMNIARFLSLTGHLGPGMGGLGQIAEFLELPKQKLHNALGDARLAADLLTKFVELADVREG
jgi:DNA polymerase III epsilon subunit-like protein